MVRGIGIARADVEECARGLVVVRRIRGGDQVWIGIGGYARHVSRDAVQLDSHLGAGPILGIRFAEHRTERIETVESVSRTGFTRPGFVSVLDGVADVLWHLFPAAAVVGVRQRE